MKIGGVTVEARTVLAPLAGVSDSPFRRLARSFGAGLVFTEMVSVEGLLRRNRPTLRLVHFREEERPVAVQLFGSRPESAEMAAEVASGLKPDLIDFNAGCPVRKVVRKEGGAALLKDLRLLERILSTIVSATDMPVTLKLRSGWDEDSVVAVEAAQMAESVGCAAVTVHPRTQRQGFSGSANWDLIAEVRHSVKIPVIGNGDVKTPEDAKRLLDQTGCDLVMIGRAALGNPWIFARANHYMETGELLPEPTSGERIRIFLKHVRMMIEEWNEERALKRARSLIGWYTRGLPNAHRLRQKIIRIDGYEELRDTLEEYHGSVDLREHLRTSSAFGLGTETTPLLGPDGIEGERSTAIDGGTGSEHQRSLWSPQQKEAEVKVLMSPRYREAMERWRDCRYLVLEHSPAAYGRIQRLLRGPMTDDAPAQVRSEIDHALSRTPTCGSRVCAALHIWGRLRGKAKNGDKLHFFYFLDAYKRGRVDIVPVKRMLYRLAKKQGKEELLDSRYFEEIECLEEEAITSETPSSARS
jgi:tRNA-dihydrouridine synthase B